MLETKIRSKSLQPWKAWAFARQCDEKAVVERTRTVSAIQGHKEWRRGNKREENEVVLIAFVTGLAATCHQHLEIPQTTTFLLGVREADSTKTVHASAGKYSSLRSRVVVPSQRNIVKIQQEIIVSRKSVPATALRRKYLVSSHSQFFCFLFFFSFVRVPGNKSKIAIKAGNRRHYWGE